MDFREQSQQYARGGFNAVIIINGAAAVAVLSQMTALDGLIHTITIGCAFLFYAIGVLLGAAAWVIGFMTTRYVDRAERGQDADYSKADRWMYLGLFVVIGGLVAFGLATSLLAIDFIF